MRVRPSLVTSNTFVVLLAALAVAFLALIAAGALSSALAPARPGHGAHATFALDSSVRTASVLESNGNGNGNNGDGGNGHGHNGDGGGGTATPELPSGVLFGVGVVPFLALGIGLTLLRRRSRRVHVDTL
jgi:hypothetical protein